MPAMLFLVLQEARVVTVAPETYAEARAAVEEYFGITDSVVPVTSADETITIEDPFGDSDAVVVVTDENERVAVGDSKRWYLPLAVVSDLKRGEGLYRVRNGNDAATEPLRLSFHKFDKGRYVTGLIALETDGRPLEPARLGDAEFKPEMVVRRGDGSACVFGRFVTESSETAAAATQAESLKVGERVLGLAVLAPQGMGRGGDAPTLSSRGSAHEDDEVLAEIAGNVRAVATRNDVPWPLLYMVLYELTDSGRREIKRTQDTQGQATVLAGKAGSTVRFEGRYEADFSKAAVLRDEAQRALDALAAREPAIAPLLPNADTFYRER